ncbi:MAG: hypothetical protein JNM97_15400, partial [Rhodoferax sp.]|nr:hypothetical protein [Rhodoferax sp.]
AGTAISRTDGNAVLLSGKAVSLSAGSSIGSLGGAITASTGDLVLSAATGITADALVATLGSIDVDSGAPVTITSLSAGSAVFVDAAGSISLGTVNAGNGIVDLHATGAASDITLGGSVTATNTGLTATQPGIRAVAGRDLLLASTTDLTTLGSGGITLQAGRDVNLKVNDGGNNGASNSLQAVGNLDITAGSGILQTDGNAVTATGANIGLAYASSLSSTIGFSSSGTIDITQTSGDLVATPFAAQSLAFHAPGGNVLFAGGSTFTGGPVSVSGAGSTVFGSGAVSFQTPLTSTMPLSVQGATLSSSAAVTAPALSLSSGTASFQVAPALGGVTQSGGTLSITTGVPYSIDTGTWTISGGQLNLPSAGSQIASGATLSVAGGAVQFGAQLDVAGTLALSSGTLAGSGPIHNTGSVQKTGAGTFTLATVFDNAGTVSTSAGSLSLTGGGTHSGSFTTAAGAITDFQGGTHSFADGVVFAGPGSFDGGGTLLLTGTTSGLELGADTVTNLNALNFGGT